jgi:hypothetical protein
VRENIKKREMHKSSFECLIGSVLCIKARIRNGPGPLALSRSLKRLNNIESDRCAQGGGLYSERSGEGGGVACAKINTTKSPEGERGRGKIKIRKKVFDGGKEKGKTFSTSITVHCMYGPTRVRMTLMLSAGRGRAD